MNEPSTQLTLELTKHEDDLISGRIIGAHGTEAFSGWLELIAILDAVVDCPASSDGPEGSPSDQGGRP